MSVTGYFARPRREGLTGLRRMVEELGGRIEGPMRPEEKLEEDRRAAAAVLAANKAGPCYVEVEKYDPVLRAHCRL